MASFEAALQRYERLFGVQPELVAHDLHPDFLSSRFAKSSRCRPSRFSTTMPTSPR